MGNSCKSVCSVNLYLLLESIRFKFTKMKTFQKIFRGKVSYKKIDKYVDLVRKTLDPDDEMQIEFNLQDDYQFIRIEVLDRVLH